MTGPPGDHELRLRTTYAPSDLSFCGSRCLLVYVLSAPEHRTEVAAPELKTALASSLLAVLEV